MRALIYLMLGLLLALALGGLYFALSAPSAGAEKTPLQAAWAAANGWLLAAVVLSWASVFVRMPGWLTVLSLIAALLFGMAVLVVSGIFVYLHYPRNTLAHSHYVAFLGSLSIVVSQLVRLVRLDSTSGTEPNSVG